LTALSNNLGKVTYRTNSYTELATGMHHLVNREWVESSEEIEITPTGAQATNGSHKVVFSGELNTADAIDLTTPGGQHLKSHVMGLSYFDPATGKSVLIAELKDSQGQLLPTKNQVLYPDAFTDIKADVRYTYRKSGFEQDIILHEQPPPPSEWGLSGAARLQVLTEFTEAREPAIKSAKAGTSAMPDETLDFGTMKMGRGKAFTLGQERPSAFVSKQWLKLKGRTFLVEEVPVQAISKQLEKLPAPPSSSTSGNQPPQNGKRASAPGRSKLASNVSRRQLVDHVVLPPPKPAKKSRSPVQLASVAQHQNGLVMDYVTTLDTETNAFTFQSDTTYYISGFLILDGTATFEGGTVLKFTQDGSSEVMCNSNVVCLTAAYRPAVFTSVNDNTVGETIAGSSGTPNPGGNYLWLNEIGTNSPIQYMRFSYAGTGFTDYMPDVSNCQFINCYIGVDILSDDAARLALLHNVLFSQMSYCAVMQDGFWSYDVHGEHITMDSGIFGVWGSTAYLTNSIFAEAGSVADEATGDNNGFYNSPEFGSGAITNTSYPFQTVGGGSYYLADNSPYRNVGTANINPTVLTSLRQKTTYPPIVWTDNITNDTVWSPQILRDTDAPDLGYHYPAIDYLANASISNAVLTLTNGVVVAGFNDVALNLLDSGSLDSFGSPLLHNRICPASCVQEQPQAYNSIYSIHNTWNGGSVNQPRIDASFTDFESISADTIIYVDPIVVRWRDCYFGPGSVAVSLMTGDSLVANNIFEHTLLGFDDLENPGGCQLSFYNNLAREGAVSVGIRVGTSTDNAFDNCTYAYLGAASIGHNAYINTTGNVQSGPGDISLTNITWLQGPLGCYYQTSDSPLINVGSRTADQAGLYHYTVTTNLVNGLQIKETNSVVDIGFHYVATDGYGNPIDTDGDGLADHFEDTTGDGTYNAGDVSDWTDYYNGNGPTLTISPPSGRYQTIQYVTANSRLPNSIIRFSVNGTDPMVTSPTLGASEAVPILGNTIFKARVWPNSAPVGNVHQRDYFVSGALAAGYFHNLSIQPDGSVWSWGAGDNGQLGNGLYTGTPIPTKIASISNAVAVATSWFTSLALLSDGTVWGWGANWSGQLGNGTTDQTNIPVQAIGLSNVVAIASGQSHSIALTAEGSVWTWGDNWAGQLGDGGTANSRSVPGIVDGLSGIVAIAAGSDNCFALDSNGSIWAWGANGDGELGDGTYDNQSRPVAVTGITNAVAVSSGYSHTLALLSDGTVWGWGANWSGQLGDGTGPRDSVTPVQAVGISNAASIACGAFHSLALTKDGILYGWGEDFDGELADPAQNKQPLPIPLAQITNGISISGGAYSTAVLTSDGTIYTWGQTSFTDSNHHHTQFNPFAIRVSGNTQDTDGDGLPDWFEIQTGTSPTSSDTDYDGVTDYQELLEGLNPNDPTSTKSLQLGSFKFDTPMLIGDSNQLPARVSGVQLVPSWSRSAVHVGTNISAWLAYNDVETNGAANINLRNGTIQFWFKPDWTSAGAGGTGPSAGAALIAVGNHSSDFTSNFWGLEFDADGNNLRFSSEGGGDQHVYINAAVSLTANRWYLITLTYTPSTSALFLNADQVATGTGVQQYPDAAARHALGFNIGSTTDGSSQAFGSFDILQTFNHPLASSGVSAAFLQPQDATNATVRFPSPLLRTNSLSIGVLGVPQATIAVLINDTNFDTAVGQVYYADSDIEIPINFTGDGVYTVNIGIWAGDHFVWHFRKITIDTTPPLVVPGSGAVTTQTPLLQFTAYSTEPLASVVYDLTNSAVTNLGQQGFVVRGGDATNWFQCFDIRLASGLNRILVRCADLAGNVTTNEYLYTLDTSSMTTPPTISVAWPPDNAVVDGITVTLNGTVSDPSATVVAHFVEDGTNTQINAVVERDGRFWIDHLLVGTSVTIVATDAAGNTASHDHSVQGGSIGIGINPFDVNLLKTNAISLSGTIGSGGYSVTVNGTAATVSDGQWQADNVPVPDGGVASFTVEATPTAGGGPTVVSQFSYDKPAFVRVSSYREDLNYNGHVSPWGEITCSTPYFGSVFDDHVGTQIRRWTNGLGGSGFATYYRKMVWLNPLNPTVPPTVDVYGPVQCEWEWPAEQWPPQPLPDPCPDLGLFDQSLPWEHYDCGDDTPRPAYPGPCAHTMIHRTAQTRLELVTGGRAAIGQPSAVLLTASSAEATQEGDINWFGGLILRGPDTPVRPENLTIAGLPCVDTHRSVETNGLVLPIGARLLIAPAGTNIDITPTVSATKLDCYSFDVQVAQICTIESNDRLIHGTIKGGPVVMNLAIGGPAMPDGFKNKVYGDLFCQLRPPPVDGPGNNCVRDYTIYDSEDDVLSDVEVDQFPSNPDLYHPENDQQVIFVRDPGDTTVLHFYTVADNYDKLEVTLSIGDATLTVTNQIAQSAFGELITLCDQRIQSAATDDVPNVSPPAPIQQRPMLTRSLIGYFKVTAGTPINLGLGLVEGFWGGMKSDKDGIAGASQLIGRFTSCAAERAAVIKQLKSITWSAIGNQIANGLQSFMSDAEKSAVVLDFGQADPFANDFLVRVYVDGYAMGFTVEQLCSTVLVGGAVSKVGALAKTAIIRMGGEGVLAVASKVASFPSRATAWVIKGAKNNPVSKSIAKTAGAMVDRVAALPTRINGKTVGEIISAGVDRMDTIYDELRLIGKPLDEFGVRAHTQIAKFLERDLGYFPGEKALRGNLRLFDSLVVGEADRYDEFIALLTRADGTLDKHTLQASAELYHDAQMVGAGGNWNIIGEAADPTIARQLTANACGSACAQTLLAERGVVVFQSNIAAEMGRVLCLPEEIRDALNVFDTSGGIWKGGLVSPGDEAAAIPFLTQNGSFAATLQEVGAPIDHMVLIDGFDAAGLVKVRDPFGGVSYRMTLDNFKAAFNGRVIYKSL
jgi:alpha-tubulin suppressor-like RCC1 family protein